MKKRKRAARGGVGSFLLGVLLSFAILIILSLIASIFLVRVKTPTKNLGAVSLIIFIASALISGFISSRRADSGELSFSILTATAFALLLLVISLIATGGNLGGMQLMNSVCYILSASLAALLGRKKAKRHRRR